MEEVGEGSRTVSVWVVWKDARAGKGEEGLVGGGRKRGGGSRLIKLTDAE